MKIVSPFVEYIPDCKKNMRRLRKKIYKFITSKNYTKKENDNKNNLLGLLRARNVPAFLVEALGKKKNIDLNAIKNMNLSARIPLSELVELSSRQELSVTNSHAEWMEDSKLKAKAKAYACMDSLKDRELDIRKTISSISSTEFEYYDEEYENEQEQSHGEPYGAFHQQLDESLSHNIQFNHFVRGSGFLQMQSSILSQENLFKF